MVTVSDLEGFYRDNLDVLVEEVDWGTAFAPSQPVLDLNKDNLADSKLCNLSALFLGVRLEKAGYVVRKVFVEGLDRELFDSTKHQYLLVGNAFIIDPTYRQFFHGYSKLFSDNVMIFHYSNLQKKVNQFIDCKNRVKGNVVNKLLALDDLSFRGCLLQLWDF